MELVEGKPLIDLENIESTTFKKAINKIAQVALALKELEALHIVHRDIKPDNIMITSKGLVKLIDFGLAIQVDDFLSKRIYKVGSPGFLAPELITGSDNSIYTSKLDIYALGITLFCMLTGEHPFDAEDCK